MMNDSSIDEEVNSTFLLSDSDMPYNQTTMPRTGALHMFSQWYAQYHGHVAVIICICGVVMNIFNIIVLSQKKMRSSTNMILTGLSVSDMLTMASYIPFALQYYILHGLAASPERNTEAWAHFFLFQVNFSVTVHTISIWLCVLLAVFRYSYVRISSERRFTVNNENTIIAIVLVNIASVIVLIPNYLSLTIVKGLHMPTNKTMYDIASIDTNSTYGHLVTSVNFWIHAILIKIIPCFLMSLFGFLLVWTMHSAKQKRKKLRRQSIPGVAAATKSTGAKTARKQKARDHTRTTSMLVVVIMLFLITELPQGILALLSGLLTDFFENYYMPLGDLMDIIALINNSINFVLYCSMSKQFRDTFLALFCGWCTRKPPKIKVTANGNTRINHDDVDYSLYKALKRIVKKDKYENGTSFPVILTAEEEVSFAKTDL